MSTKSSHHNIETPEYSAPAIEANISRDSVAREVHYAGISITEVEAPEGGS